MTQLSPHSALVAYRTPLISLVVLLVIWLVSIVFSQIGASQRLADLDIAGLDKVDITLSLDFEPERFHFEIFQDAGRYLGWQDGQAKILDVSPDAVKRLAGYYWIARIEKIEEPGT